MADESVRSPGPVNALGGFAGRPAQDVPRREPRPGSGHRAAGGDRVNLHAAAAVALALLRQRVLARTRALLELGEGPTGPEFAEVTEGEPVPVWLGRLLSAQNQIAARRAGDWPADRVRRACDQALHDGAAETLDMLAADGADDAAAIQVVAEALAEYARRVAALTDPQG
jgi:hypothetical protein